MVYDYDIIRNQIKDHCTNDDLITALIEYIDALHMYRKVDLSLQSNPSNLGLCIYARYCKEMYDTKKATFLDLQKDISAELSVYLLEISNSLD